jgi:hypothetical protein
VHLSNCAAQKTSYVFRSKNISDGQQYEIQYKNYERVSTLYMGYVGTWVRILHRNTNE